MCFDFLQLWSEIFIVLSIQRAVIKLYIALHVKYSLFLLDFNEP